MREFNLLLFCTFIFSTCFSQSNSPDRILKEKYVFYLVVGNKKFKINEEIITVKILPQKRLGDSIQIVKINKLGFCDLRVPNNVVFIDYYKQLVKSHQFETVEFNTIGEYHWIPNDQRFTDQWYPSLVRAVNNM
jgi:hypothetical protein